MRKSWVIAAAALGLVAAFGVARKVQAAARGDSHGHGMCALEQSLDELSTAFDRLAYEVDAAAREWLETGHRHRLCNGDRLAARDRRVSARDEACAKRVEAQARRIEARAREFERRMERFGERMDSSGERFGEQMEHMGDGLDRWGEEFGRRMDRMGDRIEHLVNRIEWTFK